MQPIQRIATYSGIAFVAVSALGFAAGGAHSMMSMSSTTTLLGQFPLNSVHNAVHMAFGFWGIWAGTTRGRAVTYALGSGAAYLLLAIIGLLSPTMFGLMPIGGYDIALHFLLALILACAGVWAQWLAPPAASSDRASNRRAA